MAKSAALVVIMLSHILMFGLIFHSSGTDCRIEKLCLLVVVGKLLGNYPDTVFFFT